MTITLALEYIPRRMKELGYGKKYYLRFRHMVLQPGEKIEIDAYNQFYILVDETDNLNVSSEFGEFDLSQNKTNEQLYEHQGQITVTNYSGSINHVRFIQVIPKHNKCKKIKEKEQCQ
jgi:hypothetical protein